MKPAQNGGKTPTLVAVTTRISNWYKQAEKYGVRIQNMRDADRFAASFNCSLDLVLLGLLYLKGTIHLLQKSKHIVSI